MSMFYQQTLHCCYNEWHSVLETNKKKELGSLEKKSVINGKNAEIMPGRLQQYTIGTCNICKIILFIIYIIIAYANAFQLIIFKNSYQPMIHKAVY